MRFTDIIGNSETIKVLRSMVDTDRIPHALLLAGPAGIGKMNMARAMVSYINCEHPVDGDSCGHCPSCRRMELGNNPDIHYVYPVIKKNSQKPALSSDFAEQWAEMLRDFPYMPPTKWLELIQADNFQPMIYVDEADLIGTQASLSAYADRFKIFIVWLPEKMNPSTANKLLKIIEEPLEDTLFICVSNDASGILPTIYSRLRRVEMHRPTEPEIEEALIRRGVSPDYALEAARLADGSLHRAMEIISNEGENREFTEFFRQTMRAGYGRKAGILKNLSETFAGMGREKGMRLIDYFSRMVRENYIANLRTPQLNLMNGEETDFAEKFAPFIHAANVEGLLTELDSARRDISRNANAKIVWFDTLLRLMILVRKKRTPA